MVVIARDKQLELLNRVRTVHMDECNADFEEILLELYQELDEPNTFSVMLIEQIAEALFWIKRHTRDKNFAILNAMKKKLKPQIYESFPDLSQELELALSKGLYSEECQNFEASLREHHGMGIDELRADSLVRSINSIKTIDDLINRHLQNLRHLQKSLDSVDFKKRIIKKMDLELDRIEADNKSQTTVS